MLKSGFGGFYYRLNSRQYRQRSTLSVRLVDLVYLLGCWYCTNICSSVKVFFTKIKEEKQGLDLPFYGYRVS